jgi:hypothetical protein
MIVCTGYVRNGLMGGISQSRSVAYQVHENENDMVLQMLHPLNYEVERTYHLDNLNL